MSTSFAQDNVMTNKYCKNTFFTYFHELDKQINFKLQLL